MENKVEYKDNYNFKRLAQDGDTCWGDIVKRFIDELVKRGAKTSREDLEWLCLNYYSLPNSPALLSAGKDKFYGSACSSYPISDSIDEGDFNILDTLKLAARATKAGIGVGFNFSQLRGKEEPVKGKVGLTGGPVSFLRAYDGFIKEISQATRKAACMGLLHCNHPDIYDFVNCKVKDGEISNFNISVVIDDEFMKAVEENKSYPLLYRTEQTIKNNNYEIVDRSKTTQAKELFDVICERMWENGEPGIMFEDIIKEDYFKPEINLLANPCFTGDTLIAVADGRNSVKISELSNEKEFLVYSSSQLKHNPNKHTRKWKPEIKKAKALKTGNKHTIKLILSNGDEIKCTPDHLLALSNGSYIEAQQSLDKTLERFYTSNEKYRTINSIDNAFNRQYRMIWEYYNGELPEGYCIDHKISGSSDNILNIQLLTIKEHNNKTGKERIGKNNPIHRATPKKRQWICSKSSRAENNPKFSGITNEELIILGKKLLKDNIELTIYNLKKLDSRVPLNWSLYRFEGSFPYYKKVVLGEIDYKSHEYIKDPYPETQKNYLYLTDEVKVVDIIDNGLEDVYDLIVEDNHNFYIITKGFDFEYKESRGVLVHNCSEAILDHGDNYLELCVLGSINLPKVAFLPPEDRKRVIETLVSMLNDIIDVQNYVSNYQEKGMKHINRKIGIGVAGLATVLAQSGIKYSSQEAYEYTRKTFEEIGDIAKKKSEEMYKENSGKLLEINSPLHTLERYNASILSVAPTSTISNIFSDMNEAGCSYGVEPYFSIEPYTVNNSYGKFEKQEKIIDFLGMDKSKELIECANDLDYKEHLKIVQAYYDSNWGKGITQGCSKTINFKNNAAVEDIKEAVLYCWKHRIKAFTVYKDGSRKNQVIQVKDSYRDCIEVDEKGRPLKINYYQAPKRPDSLDCDIHHVKANQHGWIVLIGLLEGKPYEIFAGLEDDIEIPSKHVKGIINKNIYYNKNRYSLIISDDKPEDRFVIKSILNVFQNRELNYVTRLVSISMRHGVPPKYIAEQLLKDGNLDAFNKALARVLKHYINENEESTEKCPECGKMLVYISGCLSCTCGFTKCG